jgi:hypothetical protein
VREQAMHYFGLPPSGLAYAKNLPEPLYPAREASS